MVGQTKNIEKFNTMKSNNNIPQAILITGRKHSGKVLLAKEFSYIIDTNPTIALSDGGIESIRNIVESTQNINYTMVYILDDIQNMSLNAVNSLLKLLEDPPRHCYFILTAEDVNLVLPTILSRTFLFSIEPYSRQDLMQFTQDETLLKYCQTPGEIRYWVSRDYNTFINELQVTVNELFTHTGVYILNKVKSSVCYDINEPNIYYEYYIKFLIDFIYKGNYDIDFNAFIDLNSWFFKQTLVKGTKKDSLLDVYLIKLKQIILQKNEIN